ncbi:diguanylate cyclase [Cellulomonas sp. APG4]|uniref:diguanylate cyclase domain-containing protein n=1 Tax=Cellulomonas sp. APG4 TaxID=1538656 RepID=UPI00137A9D12|nr:diguanylate cyclase [Cellulomonas sp. APG4]
MPHDLTLLRDLLPRTTSAGTSLPTTVAEASTPIDVVDAGLALPELGRLFRSPHLGSVVVHDGDRTGLLTRARYFASVSGELGFGRALLARATAATVADWQPLVLAPGTGVVAAALRVTERAPERRYDPVLVSAAEWRVAAPSDLIRALTALLAVRTFRDEVTGLPNLAQTRVGLAERLERSAGSPHRVAVVLLRLEGGDALRLERGDGPADHALVRATAHLQQAAPAGWDLGRVGPHDFALVGVLPGPVAAAQAGAQLDRVQALLATTLAIDPEVSLLLRSAAVCSPAGAGRADDMLHGARRRLAEGAGRRGPDAPDRVGAVRVPTLEPVGG